ncbi:MAG: hypothetical protein AAGE52_08215 [Myxococcota bacterium]
MARVLAFAVAMVLVGCGARSGLPIEEERDDAGPSTPPVDARCRGGDLGPYDVLVDAPGIARATSDGQVWIAGGVFNAGLASVSRDGGEVQLHAEEEPVINGLLARGERAFWLTVGFGDTTGELRALRGSVRSLASGLRHPDSLHFVDNEFYFAVGTNSGSLRDEGLGAIVRVNERGGSRRTLVDALGLPVAIAVGPTRVYWVDARRGQVGAVSRAGGGSEILLEGLRRPRDIQVFSGGVYVADNETVWRMGLAGEAPETVVAFDDEIESLRVTDIGVFAGLRDRSANTRVVFAAMDGSAPRLVEEDARFPIEDETRIYWTVGEIRGGVIRGACKALFAAR